METEHEEPKGPRSNGGKGLSRGKRGIGMRRTPSNDNITMRLPTALKDQLLDLSMAEGRTLSSYAMRVLAQHVENASRRLRRMRASA
jgi:hypothetical protein